MNDGTIFAETVFRGLEKSGADLNDLTINLEAELRTGAGECPLFDETDVDEIISEIEGYVHCLCVMCIVSLPACCVRRARMLY